MMILKMGQVIKIIGMLTANMMINARIAIYQKEQAFTTITIAEGSYDSKRYYLLSCSSKAAYCSKITLDQEAAIVATLTDNSQGFADYMMTVVIITDKHCSRYLD